MVIENGTDKNAIDRVKHHKAGAARADNVMWSIIWLASTKNSKYAASLVISWVMYYKFVAGIGETELNS